MADERNEWGDEKLISFEGITFYGKACFCRRRMVHDYECPVEGCDGHGVAEHD